MRPIEVERIAAMLVSTILLTGILLSTQGCIRDGTLSLSGVPQAPPPSSASVEVSGMATEIAGANISLNTATGPLVLKFDSGTVVIRFDGSTGTIRDLRPGMNITVSYDPSNKIAQKISVK